MNIKFRLVTLIIMVAISSGCLATAIWATNAREVIEPTEEALPALETQDDLPEEPIVRAAAEIRLPTIANDGFWVGELNGVAAVWHNSDRVQPIEITDIVIRSLRLIDQEFIRNGVYFENYMDVVVFLEDFAP